MRVFVRASCFGTSVHRIHTGLAVDHERATWFGVDGSLQQGPSFRRKDIFNPIGGDPGCYGYDVAKVIGNDERPAIPSKNG